MSDANPRADNATPMIDVARSATTPAAPDTVWRTIGDFCGISHWHPAVASCRREDRDGRDVRTLTLAGGGTLVEALVNRDDAAMSYTYAILEGPLPVSSYTSTIRVSPEAQGGSRIDWTGRFAAAGASQDEATGVVAGIYESGLDALVAKAGAA